MTLETAGALCLSAVLGWSAAGPRSLRMAFAEGVLALAALLLAVVALYSADAASIAALGAIAGFIARLLLDLALSAMANDQGRR